jgi:transposase
MPFREVTMIEIKETLRLWLASVPQAQIAQQLALDRKTVRRYTRAAEKRGLKPGDAEAALTDDFLVGLLLALRPAAERPRGDSWAVCAEHRAFIASCLEQGVRLTKVRKLLIRRDVRVPYMTLYRFAVVELGFGRSAATIPVADCEPGQEVQVDTGWVCMLDPDLFGKRRRVRAWIFTAVRSRHRFAWPCFRETTQSAIEACEAAWEFFAGVFRVLIPDNTKAIVTKPDPLAPRINAAFLEYAQARGFHIDTARVRSPRDKARVERSVPTVRDDCFGGEHIYDLDQARAHARDWCLREYGMRRHSTTARMPLEHFEAEERTALLPAPTEPYDVPLWCEPKVAPDQHAHVAGALYSLPVGLRGKVLRARADRALVRFYYGDELVKTHPRKPSGGRSTDPNDFPPDKSAYALRDVAFLARRAAEHGAAVGRYAQALLDGPLPWTRMRQVYALLGLARRFGDARLDDACALALAAEMVDVRRLERMLRLGPRPAPAPPPPSNVIPLSRYLRPAVQYALPLTQPQPTEPADEQ